MAAANNSSAEKARALEQCERDLDVAIERLVNLRLDAAGADHDSDDGGGAPGTHHDDDDDHPATIAAATEEEEEEQRTAVAVGAVHHGPPSDGIDDDDDGRTVAAGQWVERLMEAMASAESWGDARARAAGLLEGFGASVAAACRAERDVAIWESGVLKKAVRVQHRLCKEEVANRELRRQLAGCQNRVRSLETDNYALSMYLRNAQPQGSVTGRFHPEVF